MTAQELRKKISKDEFTIPTAGYCSGNVQTNMLVIPKKYADSF
nr:DUF1445 domain-containing protein [Sulfurospirillum sp.]